MRRLIQKQDEPTYGVFRARGREASRLEQLSDCVFALGITMSLFSTEAPKSFNQLTLFISDIVPFAISIVFVMWIWHSHYQFFMRFGLRDMKIIVLNTVLMLIVLFFIYPLKFLFSWLVTYFGLLFKVFFLSDKYINEINMIAKDVMPWQHMPELMIIYDLAFLGIFSILILMYRHALKQKSLLQLSTLEVQTSKAIVRHYVGVASVALVSLSIALVGWIIGWPFSGLFAGTIYFLIGPVSYLIGRQEEKKLAQLTAD